MSGGGKGHSKGGSGDTWTKRLWALAVVFIAFAFVVHECSVRKKPPPTYIVRTVSTTPASQIAHNPVTATGCVVGCVNVGEVHPHASHPLASRPTGRPSIPSECTGRPHKVGPLAPKGQGGDTTQVRVAFDNGRIRKLVQFWLSNEDRTGMFLPYVCPSDGTLSVCDSPPHDLEATDYNAVSNPYWLTLDLWECDRN